MTAKNLMLFCSVHGASSARSKCSLSKYVREAWRRLSRHDDALILTGIDKNDPNHGAVCAEEGASFGALFPAAHEKVVRDALKSAIRSAKIKATKDAKLATLEKP